MSFTPRKGRIGGSPGQGGHIMKSRERWDGGEGSVACRAVNMPLCLNSFLDFNTGDEKSK